MSHTLTVALLNHSEWYEINCKNQIYLKTNVKENYKLQFIFKPSHV